MLPSGATNRGFVPPHELVELIAKTTVFALPTLREPFGLAFLDAMACGVPCIGTAVEAVPEVIDHQVTGLLVPPGDEHALAEALLSLLEDPAKAHAMGLRGRLRVDAHFTWEKVGERLESALVAASNRPALPPSRTSEVA
jgi:glycosyltransferase involved in cell wall biosynthesis